MTCDKTVVIPFALNLVRLIPPVAVRLRCDVKLLLSLITSHTLLHRDNRKCDAEGHLIATVADYAAVRRLVSDYLEAAVEATVSPTIRQTVQAVESLLGDRPSTESVALGPVAKSLNLDKSAASRRIRVALGKGYLVNNEVRKGRPMQLGMGDPLPEYQTLLPSPEALRKEINGRPMPQTPAQSSRTADPH